MGTSYNTLVFYGVDLGDLSDGDGNLWAPAWMLDADGLLDWDPEDHLAKKLGWTPIPFPDHAVITAPDRFGRPSRRMNTEHPDYVAYSANQDRKRMTLAAADFGCTLDDYGHAEGDLTLLVQVDASVVKGDVWTCRRLELKDPAVAVGSYPPREWRERLERYLGALEIPAEHRPAPGWHLTGWVG
jgi:hypothetical protein